MGKKSWGQLSDEEKEVLVEDYKKMTGPQACDKHNVKYESSRNSLSRAHRKAEHGGPRKGSGMKKGTPLCSQCGKSPKNCNCFD